MQLTTYINDLLYRYECVIIPGFGAFLTQYRSAKIDESNQMFYPPGKTVSFNRQLQTNDGLLANYVASVEECSYELALQKIRSYTGKLSLQIAGGEVVSLKKIGTFELNKEQSIQFTPSEKENFNRSSFGLASFISPTINRELAQVSEKPTPVIPLSGQRALRPYLKYAAVAIIALSVGGFGGMKLYEGQVQEHNFVEKEKANTLIDKQIQEASFVIENPLPAIMLTLPKQVGRYHIVAGAFRIEDNADKKLGQLRAKGFSPQRIGVNRHGLHQVVYSSHENRLEALKALRSIKRDENKDAWLLVHELD